MRAYGARKRKHPPLPRILNMPPDSHGKRLSSNADVQLPIGEREFVKKAVFHFFTPLGIHHQSRTLLSAYLAECQSAYLGTYRASESRI
jgi:hypothetical protein